MMRLLVWMAGCCALFYLVMHYSLWHALFDVVVVSVAVLWMFGGAVLLGSRLRKGSLPLPGGAAELEVLKAAAERARAARAPKQEVKP